MNDMTSAPAKTRLAAVETPPDRLRTEIDRLFDDFGRPARNIFNFGASALARSGGRKSAYVHCSHG